MNGATGPAGPAGSTGPIGAEGYTSLIKQTVEPPGANCLNGGIKIESGVDNGDGGEFARSGTLDPGEVDQTMYLCTP